MDNVPAIVPLLEREHRVAESRLGTSKKELDDLATDKLKASAAAHYNHRQAGPPYVVGGGALQACPTAVSTPLVST